MTATSGRRLSARLPLDQPVSFAEAPVLLASGLIRIPPTECAGGIGAVYCTLVSGRGSGTRRIFNTILDGGMRMPGQCLEATTRGGISCQVEATLSDAVTSGMEWSQARYQ